MKKALLTLTVLSLISMPTFAAQDHQMAGHQGKMRVHMEEMQGVLDNLSNTQDPNKQKQLRGQHLQSMETSVGMLKDMMSAKRTAQQKCVEEGEQYEDNYACVEAETHEDTQMNMLLQMFEHLIQRQKMLGM